MGVTPATVEVKKPAMMEDRRVTLKLDGYADRTFVLQKDFQMVSILNVFTGAVGFAIDIITGAIFSYSPETYNMKLKSSDDQVKLEDLPRDAEGVVVKIEGDLTVLDEEVVTFPLEKNKAYSFSVGTSFTMA